MLQPHTLIKKNTIDSDQLMLEEYCALLILNNKQTRNFYLTKSKLFSFHFVVRGFHVILP